MSRRVHLAVFTSEKSLLGAIRSCREHELSVLDVRTPYPIHGIEELAGIPRTRLPAFCLAGGVIGLGLALWFQYWTSSVDWPINVGGKPWNSLPAFAPVAFEVTVLLAGLATVFGLLAASRLLPGRRATLTDLRITSDRFALIVTRPSADLTDAGMAQLWLDAGAVETRAFVEDDA